MPFRRAELRLRPFAKINVDFNPTPCYFPCQHLRMSLRNEFRMNRSLHHRLLAAVLCTLLLGLAGVARADVTASILGIVN